MYVVSPMTVDTTITGIAKSGRQMTGFATGCGMLTNQRENTDVMVKANLVLP
jgi:hypothetical protein